GEYADPGSMPQHQDCGQRDSVSRPYRSEVTAANVSGSLAEFACNTVRYKDNRNLTDVSTARERRDCAMRDSLCHERLLKLCNVSAPSNTELEAPKDRCPSVVTIDG